jgi:hypothetical protein
MVNFSAAVPEAPNRTILKDDENPAGADDTRYYPLSWTIIATADAHARGV